MRVDDFGTDRISYSTADGCTSGEFTDSSQGHGLLQGQRPGRD